ncbi:hypothetical protein QSJ18_11515 [Gordonia sp. ABSL1-1]|uniref:hypothetical protein n=1 Tax=Gordonia sp. ABSL1-1 TaxID=3053923 RepID=UPI00257307C4|nr:hypothetical protein [Gordonia sp. ABSL1-1]MDL9937373.1 hypothetical protein [Gordonia sp. ABSL1-1]
MSGAIVGRALTGALVVALSGFALTGCSGGETPSPGPSSVVGVSGGSGPTTALNVYERQRADGVGALLDSLSAALLRGDTATVAALLDDSASPGFRTRIMTVASNLARTAPGPRGRSLRPRLLSLRLAPTEEAERLLPEAVQSRLDAQGSSDSWLAPVDVHHALGGASTPGADEPEIVQSYPLVVARYGDSWKLVGDATLVAETPPATQLWELPGLAATDVATAGGTSVIASYRGTDTEVARVRRLLPGAIAAVTAFWGGEWPQRAVVVATGSDDEFAALAAGGGVGTAAATVFDRIDTRNQVVIGQRVILTPAARDLPEPALGVVLRHELTHVAARLRTSTAAPMWLTEGVPEYVGRKGTYTRIPDAAPDLAEAVRSSGAPAGPPADADFLAGGAQAQLAYQSAWSMAAYVAQRFGEDRLKNLYLGVAATADRGRADAAVQAALGITRTRLVADWRSWLTEQVR